MSCIGTIFLLTLIVTLQHSTNLLTLIFAQARCTKIKVSPVSIWIKYANKCDHIALLNWSALRYMRSIPLDARHKLPALHKTTNYNVNIKIQCLDFHFLLRHSNWLTSICEFPKKLTWCSKIVRVTFISLDAMKICFSKLKWILSIYNKYVTES